MTSENISKYVWSYEETKAVLDLLSKQTIITIFNGKQQQDATIYKHFHQEIYAKGFDSPVVVKMSILSSDHSGT